jgi:hypothetical protein
LRRIVDQDNKQHQYANTEQEIQAGSGDIVSRSHVQGREL